MRAGDKAIFYQRVGYAKRNKIEVKILKMKEYKAHVEFTKTGEIQCVNRDNLTVIK